MIQVDPPALLELWNISSLTIETARSHCQALNCWQVLDGFLKNCLPMPPTLEEAPVVLRKFCGDEALDGAGHFLGR